MSWPVRERALMAGTVRRGGQIAWAGLKLGVAVLRLRRRAPNLLPAYVSTTLVGLGTTFVKLGQGLSLRWDLLGTPSAQVADIADASRRRRGGRPAISVHHHGLSSTQDAIARTGNRLALALVTLGLYASGALLSLHSNGPQVFDNLPFLAVLAFTAAGLLSLRLASAIARSGHL